MRFPTFKPLISLTITLTILTIPLTGCGLISVLTGQDKPQDPDEVTPKPTPAPIVAKTPTSPLASQSIKANDFTITLPQATYEQKLIVPGRVGVGNKLFIDSKEIPVNEDGTFSTELQLTPGENTLFIKVISPNNSVYSTGRKVTYKLKPPLTISPFESNPYVSESPTFVVKGNTGPNSQVEVNGVKSESDNDGNFMVSINLKEGENVLDVTSINADGIKSKAQASLTYEKPQKEPSLIVTSPEENGFVSSGNIKLTGFTDPENLIEVYNNYQVDDEKVNSLIFSGNVKDDKFSINTTLSEGENELIIKATDPQGETKEVTRNITYKKMPEQEGDPDTEAPIIEFFQASPLKLSRSSSSNSNTTNTLELLVKATDKDSAVSKVIVEYYNPDKTRLLTIDLRLNNTLKAWTGSYEFESSDKTGDYTLNTIYVYDRAGNWKPYTSSDLKGKYTTTFTLQ